MDIFGNFTNEFEAAYDLASREQTSHRINVPAGKFVVVEEMPAYCPFTDAMLRHPARTVVGTFDTREAAEADVAARFKAMADMADFGEVSLAVYGGDMADEDRRQRAAMFSTRRDDDEIPF